MIIRFYAKNTSSYYFDDLSINIQKDITTENFALIQADDYYPYGLAIQGNMLTNDEEDEPNNFLYQGKEWQSQLALNLYDFHARQYDPATGRFLGVDPKAYLMYGWTPYHGMGNNPLLHTDPTGEILPIVAAMIAGAVINTGVQAAMGNIDDFGDFLGAALVGAATGAVTFGVAQGVSAGIGYAQHGVGTFGQGFSAAVGNSFTGASSAFNASSSFFSGAAIGSASGAAGGFVGGSGNAWNNGAGFKDGLTAGGWGALSGGLTGGVVGGIGGGINAAKDGRRFFDGATVKDVTIDRQYQYVPQKGDYNCGAACGESATRGNVSQSTIRNNIDPGSNPNTTGLKDIRVAQEFQKNLRRSVDIEKVNKSAQNIYNQLSNGGDVLINSRVQNMNIGHAVLVNKATERTISKVSGKLINKYIIYVMDPSVSAGGQYIRFSNDNILNAYKIFTIK